MLIIRQPQTQALADAARRAAAASFGDVLRQHFPRQCARMQGGIAAFVERGMPAAEGHGLATRQQVLYYLGVMLAAGVDFVDHHEPGWATDLLARSTCSPMANLEEAWRACAGRPQLMRQAGGAAAR